MSDEQDGITRRTAIAIGAAGIAVGLLPAAAMAVPATSPALTPALVKMQTIFDVVTRSFGVTIDEILSPERTRRVVEPRQVGMYLAYRLTGRSLPEIGRCFGGRDHTTVLYAARKIARPRPEHEFLAQKAATLIAEIERVMAAQGQAIDWPSTHEDADFWKYERGSNPKFDEWLDWRERNSLSSKA